MAHREGRFAVRRVTQDRGRLAGIARRERRLAPMETLEAGEITCQAGLVGDHKGLKFKKRALTVLALEDWEAALSSVPGADEGVMSLDWTVRRANLLTEGLDLPKAVGGRLRIGTDVVLEVTYPCQPCKRMEDACPGLLKALHPDWRGGVTARVIAGGVIRMGDRVEVIARPPSKRGPERLR